MTDRATLEFVEMLEKTTEAGETQKTGVRLQKVRSELFKAFSAVQETKRHADKALDVLADVEGDIAVFNMRGLGNQRKKDLVSKLAHIRRLMDVAIDAIENS